MADSTTGRANPDALRLRAGLFSGYGYGDTVYAGSEALARADTDHLSLQAWTLSLLAGVDLPGGRGLSLLLPTGQIRTDSDYKSTRDTGLGDLELRARQELATLLGLERAWPRLHVSLGLAAPTGGYLTKDEQQVAVQDVNLTLGRGAFWLLADAETGGAVAGPVAWFAGVFSRVALSETEDGFRWGPEVRGNAGGSVVLWPERLTASAAVDLTWRGRSSELDYLGERVDFLNGGGRWLDLVPALRGELGRNLQAMLSLRLPLWREVVGVQSAQSYAVFLGLTGTLDLGGAPARPGRRLAATGDRPDPDIAGRLPAGKVTLVDYWASWCAPCGKLSAELERLVAGRAELALVKVDASDWQQAELERFLPGVPGLPALDVYGPDGRLLARLEGPRAFDYAQVLPDAATATAGP